MAGSVNGEELLAVAGLVLIVVGVIVMAVPMVRATVGRSAVGRVSEELAGLSARAVVARADAGAAFLARHPR